MRLSNILFIAELTGEPDAHARICGRTWWRCIRHEKRHYGRNHSVDKVVIIITIIIIIVIAITNIFDVVVVVSIVTSCNLQRSSLWRNNLNRKQIRPKKKWDTPAPTGFPVLWNFISVRVYRESIRYKEANTIQTKDRKGYASREKDGHTQTRYTTMLINWRQHIN